MKLTDIPYRPEHGMRGLLDIHGQADAQGLPVILLIHGGGLREYSKERMDGVAAFLAAQGWAVANINYRLLPTHPYPIPLLDVLAAMDWVQTGQHPYLARQDLARVALMGASAGGLLALMAGFLLGRPRVRGVISLSGVTLPERYSPLPAAGAAGSAGVPQAGYDPRLFRSPAELIDANTPPALFLHSVNDRLVAPDEPTALHERLAQAGRLSELYLFHGPGELHGIWQDQESPSPQLFEHIEKRIAAFLEKIGS